MEQGLPSPYEPCKEVRRLRCSGEMDEEEAEEFAALAPAARKRALLVHMLEQADDFSGEELVEEGEGEDDGSDNDDGDCGSEDDLDLDPALRLFLLQMTSEREFRKRRTPLV